MTIHRDRQTKIVATLGPASHTLDIVRELFIAGVDVFRLNFSHGTPEDHKATMAAVRKVEAETGRPIAVLADMQGPKLRIGAFEETSIILREGQSFRLDLDDKPGDVTRVCLPHPEIFQAVEVGSSLLLDDGKVRLLIKEKGADYLETIVEAGKALSDRKGVNVPNVILPLSSLTEKDLRDLDLAMELGADWIGLSFVQRPEDIVNAQEIIKGRASILAKIEKPSAMQFLEEIIEKADGVMIARGDLGVEMPIEDVPGAQKRIIKKARQIGRPVIVATQMLESMITSPMPTRAEASDVATAVYDRADAVMLSAETASGQYPIDAVKMMDRIIRKTKRDLSENTQTCLDHPDPLHTGADAITAAARQVAETIDAAAIITYTTSGSTTLRAARERPLVPIMGLTPNIKTARQLQLSYGVHAVHTADVESFSEMVGKAVRIAFRDELAVRGDRVIITAGVPFGTPGSTNVLRIAIVEDNANGHGAMLQ